MSNLDPKLLPFSQAHGYEPLPQPLKLEELSPQARIGFWNILYREVVSTLQLRRSSTWGPIFQFAHTDFFGLPLDQWQDTVHILESVIRPYIMNGPFNKVFDLLTFLMRVRECPPQFISNIGNVFHQFQLAYVLDGSYPPTIYPTSTPEEGQVLLNALQQIREAGLSGARSHLRNAATSIDQEDWTGAVRESIHAVESVARQITPGAQTLGDALRTLEREGLLQHPALREGFSKIYGYTNDEQGIRHALLDAEKPNVSQDEAIFMLGACASFASYLSRKQLAM